MAHVVHTNMKIWGKFWNIYVVTNWIADNFLCHPYPRMIKAIMPCLEYIKILKNYHVHNISTGLMYVIYNPIDVEGILSSICLIYPWFLWWMDIHYRCHYVFPHGNLCDGYFCNSIGYYLNWDIRVYPQLLITYP